MERYSQEKKEVLSEKQTFPTAVFSTTELTRIDL
jgi:hypothetical protein